MSEEKEPTGKSPNNQSRRTRTAEVADAASEAAVRIAHLTPQQLLSLVAVLALSFLCSLQAYQVYSEREDRKHTATERQVAYEAQLREWNAQAELSRQHCASEARELRHFFAEQNERRLKFEAEEREKDRATIVAVTLKLSELERTLRKLP